MREASMVMVLDEASRLALDQKISGTEIVKCPNFIDINEVEGFINEDNGDADPYDTDVLFVGHVLPSKGVEDLVQACCNFPEIRLAVVGQVEKAYADHLANLANRSAVKIRLTGEMERTTVLREMSRAKAIALPSYTEGFPNVVLEAMAVGVPVIATPVGAVPEILGFGTSSPWGREVKVGNVSSLSEAIADLLSNPGSWKEMGMRARNIVRGRFDVGVVFPMFLMHLEHTVRGEGT
jgi:glycosyltransferase involved in cell wall biosynthesis